MAIVTVKIDRKRDLALIEEILNRFGLSYNIDQDHKDYTFSDAEIKELLQAKQDFIDGKTTCRSWKDIENDINNALG